MTEKTGSEAAPLAVFGSVNVDIVCRAERLPRPGETVHADSSAITLGGKGANQAAAIAKLGRRVELAGRTGTDVLATLAREKLASFGVGLAHLVPDAQTPTGIALIGIDREGQNSIMVSGGANMAIDAAQTAALASLFAAAPVLLLQLEIPLAAVLAAAQAARAGGAKVILDPAPACALPDEAFRLADIMTPNETETEMLVGLRPTSPEDAAQAAERLLGRGLGTAIIKLGARGVYYRSGATAGFVPPFPVTAIDSVAAGDSFNGGLAFALARGDALADAVRFAAACGALATTKAGASDAAPLLAEVEALLRG